MDSPHTGPVKRTFDICDIVWYLWFSARACQAVEQTANCLWSGTPLLVASFQWYVTVYTVDSTVTLYAQTRCSTRSLSCATIHVSLGATAPPGGADTGRHSGSRIAPDRSYYCVTAISVLPDAPSLLGRRTSYDTLVIALFKLMTTCFLYFVTHTYSPCFCTR